jgi:hypothetical protein
MNTRRLVDAYGTWNTSTKSLMPIDVMLGLPQMPRSRLGYDRKTSTPAVGWRKWRPFLCSLAMAQLDPNLPLDIGPMNGRETRESSLRLKAWVAPQANIRGVALFAL